MPAVWLLFLLLALPAPSGAGALAPLDAGDTAAADFGGGDVATADSDGGTAATDSVDLGSGPTDIPLFGGGSLAASGTIESGTLEIAPRTLRPASARQRGAAGSPDPAGTALGSNRFSSSSSFASAGDVSRVPSAAGLPRRADFLTYLATAPPLPG